MENSRASLRSKTPNLAIKKYQQSQQEQQEQEGQIASIWKAKQERIESDRNVAMIQNRLNMLKKEEQKTEKKIAEAKKKTDDVITKKKQMEDQMRRKLQIKMQEEEFQKFMQNKQLSLRNQQKNERSAIRNAITELKKEETEEVKRVSRNNSEKLHGFKLKEIEVRRQKHDYIQHKKIFWKDKVSNFWEEKIQKQYEEKTEKQKEEVKNKIKNDKLINALEQEELHLIKKIQFSQNLAENALKQLDDVQKLNNQDFISKYRQERSETHDYNNKQFPIAQGRYHQV